MAGSHLVTPRGGRPGAVAGACAFACALVLLAALARQREAASFAPPADARAAVPEARARAYARAGTETIARAVVAPVRAAPASAREGVPALLRRPPAQLRDSVLQALARPAEGGRLYARELLRQCAAADAVAGLHAPEGDDPGHVAPPDPADPRVARALARQQQLQAACRQLTDDELSAGANIVRNEADGVDPLLDAADRYGTEPGDARARLRRVLAQADPLVLQEIAPRLLEAAAAPDIAEPALALLPCALGLPCDDGDPQVWTACLQGQGCADGREALVLQRAAAGDAARRQHILALVQRLARAAKAGDDEAFASALGPGP